MDEQVLFGLDSPLLYFHSADVISFAILPDHVGQLMVRTQVVECTHGVVGG